MANEIVLTAHVVERYMDRVRPVPKQIAERELAALLEQQEPHDRPEWLPPEHVEPQQSFVEISEGICVVLNPTRRGFVATTLLCRSSRSNNERLKRRERRRRKRKQEQGQREFMAASGRRRKQQVRRRIEEALHEL